MYRAQTCSTVCSNRLPRSFRRFFTRIGSPQFFILLHFTNINKIPRYTARYFQICQSRKRLSVIKTGTRVTLVKYRRSLNEGTRSLKSRARDVYATPALVLLIDTTTPDNAISGDAHAQSKTALFPLYSMEVIAEKNASSSKNIDRSIAYNVVRRILFLISIYF